MSQKPVLVVMAAGMGGRYGGLKQVEPAGNHGQLILDYSLYDARRAGFQTAVIVIPRTIEHDFHRVIGERISRAMEVRPVFQDLEDLPQGYTVPRRRRKPWGTAHAVLAARHAVKGPFAVINADDHYGPEGFRRIFDYLNGHPDGEFCEYAMVSYPLGNTLTDHGSVSRGICAVTEDGYLNTVTERTDIAREGDRIRCMEDDGVTWTDLPADTPVSMNLWGFTRSFLDEAWAAFPAFLDRALAENPLKAEYFLPGAVARLTREGKARVKVLSSPDRWYGVTYRADRPALLAAIREMTEAGLYPDRLWEVT